MGAGKSRLDGCTLEIVFEGDKRAFDADHPITGTININTNQAIPAYGVQLKLELIDMSKEVDHGDKGQRYEHKVKRRAWEKSEMLKCFDGNICQNGHTSIPFAFQVPADLPQSLYFAERWAELRCKIRYFFKAQIVPVSDDLINNEWGKCKVRDRQRVHVSPVRPIVNDPQFNIAVPFKKKVGLVGGKMCNMNVTMSKSFFLAGEMAYLALDIDNSACGDPCNLIISHNSKVKIYQSWRKYSVTRTHSKENFYLCGANERKQLILQFQIAAKRKSPQGTGFFGKHAGDYHHVNSLVPESMFAQTFSVQNFLELYLSHSGTVFSNDSTKKFMFQLIQPSLVEGVLNPPPPIFLDQNGVMMSMENPVIDAPQGEIVQGEAMDIEDKQDKKGKNQPPEEEPNVGPAQQ